MQKKPLSTDSEWTFPLLQQYDQVIGEIAANQYQLDTYKNQIEVVSAEQMMDAYAATGMPLNYHHWSFGKTFVTTEKNYKRGAMGLAYELVINSDPCIAYLMEENTMTLQALVIAHACYGHNSFFKGNYLFKTWTSADSIIDYLLFAKNYISQCERRYGFDQVEQLLDSCHALANYGVDRYKRPQKISIQKEQLRQQQRASYLQSQINHLWRTLPQKTANKQPIEQTIFPKEPQENILYFIEKNAPLLEPWQREIVRIVRKIAQYFYPQKQTKVMNEGWASFWHYTLLNTLYDQGLVTDGFMIEFLASHSNVLAQPSFDHPYYSGINPYTLGFAIFQDIRRICENPNQEDKQWFPDIAGSPWLTTLDFAMRNFKDESFISQYLSPKVIRDLKLFSVIDDDREAELIISSIHNQAGYHYLRQVLSEQYNLSNYEPNIQIYQAAIKGDRSLTLRHYMHNRQPLAKNTKEMLKHLYRLWSFPVHLEEVTPQGNVFKSHSCPELAKAGLI